MGAHRKRGEQSKRTATNTGGVGWAGHPEQSRPGAGGEGLKGGVVQRAVAHARPHPPRPPPPLPQGVPGGPGLGEAGDVVEGVGLRLPHQVLRQSSTAIQFGHENHCKSEIRMQEHRKQSINFIKKNPINNFHKNKLNNIS